MSDFLMTADPSLLFLKSNSKSPPSYVSPSTSDIVADLNTLAHSTVVDDLAIIGATGVVDDLETCANNLATIQDFADKYRIANSAPGSDNDDGDLYYNTQTNQLNVYEAGSSAWSAIGLTQAQTQTEANNASVAMSIALG